MVDHDSWLINRRITPRTYQLTLADCGLEIGPLAADAGRDGPRLPPEDGPLMGTAASVSSASEPAYMTDPPASSATRRRAAASDGLYHLLKLQDNFVQQPQWKEGRSMKVTCWLAAVAAGQIAQGPADRFATRLQQYQLWERKYRKLPLSLET